MMMKRNCSPSEMKTTLALVLLLYLAKLIVFVRLVLIINDWAGSYVTLLTLVTLAGCWPPCVCTPQVHADCRLQIVFILRLL